MHPPVCSRASPRNLSARTQTCPTPVCSLTPHASRLTPHASVHTPDAIPEPTPYRAFPLPLPPPQSIPPPIDHGAARLIEIILNPRWREDRQLPRPDRTRIPERMRNTPGNKD